MIAIAFPITYPIRFISAGQFVSAEGWVHSERVINSYEVIIGIEGELMIEQDGVEYAVRRGNLLLLLPGVVHRGTKPCHAGTSFLWLHILLEEPTLLQTQEEVDDTLRRLSMERSLPHTCHCMLPIFAALRQDDKVDIFFHQLLHLISTPYYTTLVSHYVTTSLIIQLCQNYVQFICQTVDHGHPARNFEGILEYVRIHCTQKLYVQDVADHFGYNSNYFSRLFKKETRTSFTAYMNKQRIARAKTMLYVSGLTIKEIAWQTGFEDEKYFMKVFRAFEGLTPTKFRNAFYLMHRNNQ